MIGTRDLVRQLRREGFRIYGGYLAYLLREDLVPEPEHRLGRAYIWQAADVRRVREALTARHRGPGASGKEELVTQ